MVHWRRLSFSADAELEEDLVLRLHDLGTLGVESRDGLLHAWFPESSDVADVAARLTRALGAREGRVTLVATELEPDGRWQERWFEGLSPFTVGRRLLIAPGPAAPPRGEGRLIVRLIPGRAFGTGDHATTRTCLELIEDHVGPGDTVLDVGTGSGILAIAARLLGAARVIALDTDAEAARSARDGASLNAADGILVVAGGLAALRPGRADLVLANLAAPSLVRLMPDLAAWVGRAAVLSGILDDQEVEVVQAARRAGMCPSRREVRGEWTTFVMQRDRR